jgi:uncharacterized delta-60 repeat protein
LRVAERRAVDYLRSVLVRTRLLVIALLALGAATAAPAASAAPGQLDPSFGSGGVVKLLPSEEEIFLSGVAAQADGKIVLAGSDPGGVLLARLLENGALDPGFGAGGVVRTPFAGFGEARAIAIQPDGRIVVAGSAEGVADSDFLVARYLSSGALDPSFGGGDGIVLVPVGVGEDGAEAVAIGVAGRILVTGQSVMAPEKDAVGVAVLLADGTLDPAFKGGSAALYTTEVGQDTGVAVVGMPDGRILLGNSNGAGGGDGFTLLRLLPSGVGDPAFGGDGSVETPIPGVGMMDGAGRVTDLALRPDGRIVASGYGDDYVGEPLDFDQKWAAVGYLPNGDLDPGFGTAGIFTRQIDTKDDAARSLELTPSGGVMLGGYYEGGDGLAAIALGPAGALDSGFGSGGIFQRAERAEFGDLFGGTALDPFERLVILGTAYVGGGNTEHLVIRLGDPLPPLAQAAAINKPPHARMKPVPKRTRANRLNGFVGTANDPDGPLARVQVAVTKVLPRGAKASARNGGPKCLAMKNAKAKFKPAKRKGAKGKKRCQPRWLNVKGTAKWGFKLKRDLAPGKYVVYARAIDAAGLAETSFSRKAGNRYAFRVLPAD